jgi:glycosyltransferase involved in cell wall biosynthesis
MKIKLAIVGIEGLPNMYGGFETLASFLVKYLGDDFEMTVYCSSKDIVSNNASYETAHLKYIPFSSHGWQGILYDILSLRDAIKLYDMVLFLGFGAGIYFPFISKKDRSKLILNFGGLDWQRSKWNFIIRKIIQAFESLMVKNVDWVIADNKKIAQYIQKRYQKIPVEIAYGGDQVNAIELSAEIKSKYLFLNQAYACAVCRIQPDNNVEMILKAFSKTKYPLVMIGNWDSSAFGKQCRARYGNYKHIHLLDAIYDPSLLNMIRSNSSIYIHGHSAGGTNPSLLEAMHLGLNIFAYASGYNEITTNYLACYFNNSDGLVEMIEKSNEFDSKEKTCSMQLFAKEHYTWAKVASAYSALVKKAYLESNGK